MHTHRATPKLFHLQKRLEPPVRGGGRGRAMRRRSHLGEPSVVVLSAQLAQQRFAALQHASHNVAAQWGADYAAAAANYESSSSSEEEEDVEGSPTSDGGGDDYEPRATPPTHTAHQRLISANAFNLDERGLPRSPCHRPTCLRTPTASYPVLDGEDAGEDALSASNSNDRAAAGSAVALGRLSNVAARFSGTSAPVAARPLSAGIVECAAVAASTRARAQHAARFQLRASSAAAGRTAPLRSAATRDGAPPRTPQLASHRAPPPPLVPSAPERPLMGTRAPHVHEKEPERPKPTAGPYFEPPPTAAEEARYDGAGYVGEAEAAAAAASAALQATFESAEDVEEAVRAAQAAGKAAVAAVTQADSPAAIAAEASRAVRELRTAANGGDGDGDGDGDGTDGDGGEEEAAAMLGHSLHPTAYKTMTSALVDTAASVVAEAERALAEADAPMTTAADVLAADSGGSDGEAAVGASAGVRLTAATLQPAEGGGASPAPATGSQAATAASVASGSRGGGQNESTEIATAAPTDSAAGAISTAAAPAAAAGPLPPAAHPLDAPISMASMARRLRGLSVFGGWRLRALEDLCERLPRRTVRRYEVLYHEGQPANAAYILLSGHVALTPDGVPATKPSSGLAPDVNPSPATIVAAAAAAVATAEPHAAAAPPTALAHGERPRLVYDPVIGRTVGVDVAVSGDTTLTTGDVFGLEAIAQLPPPLPSAGRGGGAAERMPSKLPRMHTATTVTERAVLLVLPASLLHGDLAIARELERSGSRRQATLAVVKQGLARAPIFASQSRPRLAAAAQHFQLRVYAAGDRLVEEGRRHECFHVLLHGQIILSQRTAWGRMRLAALGMGRMSESVIGAIRHDAKMPFCGEGLLRDAARAAEGAIGHYGRASTSEDLGLISHATARAAEPTAVLCLPREAAASFLAALPNFVELMQQRSHLQMQKSMHAVAMLQATEKYNDDVAHPSTELREALELAKQASQAAPKQWARKATPPHPHSVPRLHRGRTTENARVAMLASMEVHSVAVRMGLAPKPTAEGAPTSAGGKAARPPSAGMAGVRGPMGARHQSAADLFAAQRQGALAPGHRSMPRLLHGAEQSALRPASAGPGAGGRFLNALWELQAAKKILMDAVPTSD